MKNNYKLIVGERYYITEPDYDDEFYNEGFDPDTYLAEVLYKNRFGYAFKDVKYDFTFERTFEHLKDCKIEKA